jgi:Zn finger protein HypA/HybF involved in hydrogenase expression
MAKVSGERYELACNNYEGWCRTCQKFTRCETEPDACNYECPECGLKTVMGAEEAICSGDLMIAEEVQDEC